MIAIQWKSGAFYLTVVLVSFACSESGQQGVERNQVAVSLAGEHSIGGGDHEIHYNAFNSTSLQPEVANLYGIAQDEDLGVAMVSVYQKDSAGVGVEARVKGAATNLALQLRMLDFDEIREGEAIYYVSTFSFDQAENLTFDVNVEIVETGKSNELKWRQQFWRE